MIRVFIVEDFAPMRIIMRRLIERQEEMMVAGEASRFSEALVFIQQHQSDVIVMDDRLPPMDSVRATCRIRELGIVTPILVVSAYPDAALVQRSLESGVTGFIFRGECNEHLIKALRAVCEGGLYLSAIAQALLRADSE